ncbi:hypothetical protein Tsubulata_002212 [Turnera subulata]|uniref:Uncharacterized protein n=1 Tax=Turnera subulata TaxID=218843 RepID=A0A9Q0F8C6_9ROSI|nr:hypothetical protein Tsubulata_002212 [Turnera subulata]
MTTRETKFLALLLNENEGTFQEPLATTRQRRLSLVSPPPSLVTDHPAFLPELTARLARRHLAAAALQLRKEKEKKEQKRENTKHITTRSDRHHKPHTTGHHPVTITVNRAPPPASPARAALPSPSFSSRRRRRAARGAFVCNRVTGATRDDPPTTPLPRFTSSLARDGPPCLPPRARCKPRPSPSRRRRPATQVSSRLKTTPPRPFQQPGRGRAGLTRRVPGLGSNRIAHSDLGFPLGFGL